MSENAPESPPFPPLNTTMLTWAALIGRWVDFARSALALPDDAAGRRLRDAVPDIIGLQAVWHALGQLGDLPRDEQALGLDRAEVLIERHEGHLTQRWSKGDLPTQIAELIADAHTRLAAEQARFDRQAT